MQPVIKRTFYAVSSPAFALALTLGFSACAGDATGVSARAAAPSLQRAGASATASSAGSLNGRAGTMPSYYDEKLFTINFKEEPSGAEPALLANNGSINIIYMSDGGLPGGAMFISVLDAIQGDGFNPLWREVQITFNPGFTPRQLTSDTEVEAAAASGEITLTPTNEVYRCSVVGPKKK